MTEREKIIDRIRKLVAMSNDAGSPNEAAIAAKRVKSMLDKYELEMADVLLEEYSRGEGLVAEHFATGRKQTPRYYDWLIVALGECFNVNIRWDRNGRKLEGFETDVAAVKVLAAWIGAQVYAMGSLANPHDTWVSTRQYRGDFRKSCASQTASRIREYYGAPKDQQSAAGKTQALVARTKQLAVREQFGDPGYGASRAHYSSRDAYESGRRAADSINITRGIGGKDVKRLT